jgi:hypothetical protein
VSDITSMMALAGDGTAGDGIAGAGGSGRDRRWPVSGGEAEREVGFGPEKSLDPVRLGFAGGQPTQQDSG